MILVIWRCEGSAVVAELGVAGTAGAVTGTQRWRNVP